MKRQANVLSALIQNFDTAEKVIETSANSAGSALRENEKYLDSIQGKIDQFSNAVQSMWSNTFDSDLVKGVIALGTELIKIIDKIGLLQTVLIALATYSMIKNKMGPIAFLGGISDLIRDVVSKVGGFIGSLTGMTAATSAYTAETLAASVANGTLSASEAAGIATKNGLTLATTNLTAAEAAEMLTKAGIKQADALAIVDKLGLTSATSALTMETVKATMANAGYTPAQIAAANAALFGAGANTTLTASLMALWTALWPILAVVGAVIAIWAAWTYVLDPIINKTENLQEELKGLKAELNDIQSELDSVNSELEITEERMSELLAKDKLSFVEEEELKDLKATREELERIQRIKQIEEERKKEDVADKAVETINSQMSDTSYNGKWYDVVANAVTNGLGGAAVGGMVGGPWGAAIMGVAGIGTGIWYELAETRISTEDKLNEEIENYQSLIDKRAQLETELEGLTGKDYDKKKKELDKLNKEIKKSENYVDDTLLEMQTTLDGVEYGYGADEELDKYYNLLYKNEIARGTVGAEADGLGHIFSRPEHEAAKKELDGWVEALKNGDESAKTAIEGIISSNDALIADIEAMGLDLNDAVNYFAQISQEANFATLEGKIAEMQTATSKMQTLLSNTQSTDFTSLFDENGEVSEVALATYFQGTSEATRAEIAKLIKDINDGKINVENALKQFEIFSIQSSLDIYITEVQTNFKDVFVELEEADGLIDTFKELGEAIGSTADALKVFNKAEAEMANSGRVSIQTALELMEYTDDYGSILEVVDGKLRLVDNAEEVLIQTRIDAIKTSAEASLSDATNAYSKAQLATQTYKDALTTDMSAEVVAKSWEKVLAAAAGLWEGIKSLLTEESWTEAYNRAYGETLSNMTGYETEYTDAGLQALVDAEAEAKAAMESAADRVELANQLTPETLEAINDADGVDTKEDVAKNRFQEAMDYWENRIAANQARYEQLQNEIDLLEAKGQKADASYYEEQINLENERLSLLQQQKSEAQSFLGIFAEGSDEWWEVANTLNDIESELDDVTASIVDLQDAIGEIDAYKFEEFNTRLDNLISKLGTIRDLIAPDGEEDWFDDEGNWTESGVAVLGSHVQELEMYKQGYQETMDELAKYQSPYAGNEDYYASLGIHSEQEYYDKVEGLTEQQYDFAKSISDSEQSIVDMYESNIDAIEEYTQTLVDSYNDYIDSVKEALDAERD